MRSFAALSLMVLSMLCLVGLRGSGNGALALHETGSSAEEVATVTEPYASRNLRRGGVSRGSRSSYSYSYSSSSYYSYSSYSGYYSYGYSSAAYIPMAYAYTYSYHYYGAEHVECLPADTECIAAYDQRESGSAWFWIVVLSICFIGCIVIPCCCKK